MAETAPDRFARMLRRFRTGAGMTQEALAEEAGYSTVYISMLERGRREPAAETIDILARALGLNAAQRDALVEAARNGPSAPARLVGRRREQSIIDRHLGGTGPPILVLVGEPGIGKSALMSWSATRAGLLGLTVMQAGAQRSLSEPHAPVAEAIRGLIATFDVQELSQRLAGCAWLVRLLPELAATPIESLPSWSVSPEAEGRLMADAVIRFLTTAGRTVLLLDDLHWAGRDGLDLLAVIARAAPRMPLRIVASYRDTDVDRRHSLVTWIADLAHAGLIAPVHLGPLDDDAAADLLVRELGDGRVPATSRDAMLQRSGGVPFYLMSCAQSLRDGSAGPEDVPWTVEQSVRQRLAALPEGSDEILAALAAAAPASPDLLAHVAGLEPGKAVAALEAAFRNRLVADDAALYSFSHDLIREVVDAGSTGARKRLLHRRTAEYLEQEVLPLPAERLARHLVRGGLRERAVPYLRQAGEEARRSYAIGAAAGYFRELLDIQASLGLIRDAAEAGEQLADVLTIAAEYEEALGVLAAAERRYRELDDREGIWRAVARIGRVHAARGSAEDGIRHLRGVVPPDQSEPSGGLARLLTSLARLHFVRGDYAEQLEAGDAAIRHARGIGDDLLLTDALNVWSVALGMVGRIPESLEAYDEVIRLGTEVGLLHVVRTALGNAAATYLEGGQFAEGRPYVERALTIAEQIGDPTYMAFIRSMRADLAFYTGDWVTARADLDAALDLLRTTESSSLTGQTLLTFARLLLAAGDTATAMIYIDECLASEELQTQREAHSFLAEIDLADRRPQEAIERLLPLLDRSDTEEWDVTPLIVLLAEAHLALGQLGPARELARSAVRRARDQGFGLALVDALRVTALIQRRDGDAPAALATVAEGIDLARAMPHPLGEARLLVERSRIEAMQSELGGADASRREALVIAHRLGASPKVLGLEAEPGRPSPLVGA